MYQRRTFPSNTRRPLVALLASALIGGCASSTPEPQVTPGESRIDLVRPGEDNDALLRLTNAENGLEVRSWTIGRSESEVRRVLLSNGAEELVRGPEQAMLHRNGMKLLRIPASALNSILEEFGVATVGATSWYGQVVQWRAMVERRIEHDHTPVAIDGRIRHLPAGRLDLMIRSWVMPMEDGPHLHFEMSPRFRPPRDSDLRRLIRPELGVRAFEGVVVASALERDWVYVLTHTGPDEDWTVIPPPEEPAPAVDAEVTAESEESEEDSNPPRLQIGPGEAVEAPPTLGELFLLDVGLEDQRTIFILVPRIQEELSPSDDMLDQPATTS